MDRLTLRALEFFDVGEVASWLASLDREPLSTEEAPIMNMLDQHLAAWRRGEVLPD